LVRHNKLLGEFNLEGIPPARKGMPQIEVTLDIDANGIMHVGAKDQATGKQNTITIKANSGLSDAEIQQMIKDAEEHAEDDKKAIDLINMRNIAESQVNSMKSDLAKYRDKVEEEHVTKLEAAIAAVEDALKTSEDSEFINSKITDMMHSSNELYRVKSEAEKAEADAKAAEQPATEATAESAAPEVEPTVADAEVKEKPTNG